MENCLEIMRNYHENREILVKLMCDNVLTEKNTSDKQKLFRKLKLKYLVSKYQETTKSLLEYYEDSEGTKKQEVSRLTDINNFYRELKMLYKNSDKTVSCLPMLTMVEFDQSAEEYAEKALQKFTDEENFGSCLDLHKCYQSYLNVKLDHHQDYIGYLKCLKELPELPDFQKDSRYRCHLKEILEYFEDFLKRFQPMEEEKLESYKQKIDEEVTQEIQKRLSEMEEQLVDLSAFSSWDEMRALGSEMLKNHLMCRGLKAGGNLEMRAKRLFSARFETAAKSLDPKIEKLIRLEQAFLFYVDLLNSKIYKTIDNVQRKQAGAYDDSDSELEESEEDDENDQIIPYNPKNLPLQADGMPIPYWLYKLQGLKFTFACEICGNHVYRGPKSFQKHFSESRHAHGMKCLGIPNTSHFFFVTSIEEVLDLHKKIKDDRKKLQWDGTDEEMEDTFGNTMKRKVWLDLKRQGCI